MATTSEDRLNGVNSSAAIKVPSKAVSTSNITLSGEQTVDGVACVTNDRVLVAGQTTQSENGVYVVDSGAWSRAKDFDGAYDVKAGTLVYVNSGTVNAGTLWKLTTADPITIGASSLTFAQISTGGGGGGSGAPFDDGTAVVKGSIDATKQLRFEVDGFTPGQTRVATPPDEDFTMVGKDTAQTLKNKSLEDSTTFIVDNADNTKKAKFQVSGVSSSTTREITVQDKDGTMALLSDIAASSLVTSITGLLPTSITSGGLTVTSGRATDSTYATMLVYAGGAWAASNGNNLGGYQGGTTLPSSSTIHFFVIAKSDGSSVGTFASTSVTPTLPATHTGGYYRRIFSLKTDGSGNILGGTSIEIFGGAQILYLSTQVLDVNNSAPGTSSRTLFTLSVPTGIKVSPLFRMTPVASGSGGYLVTSPDETDVAAATPTQNNYYSYFTAAPGYDAGVNSSGSGIARNWLTTTNTSGQIGIRATGTSVSNLYLVTGGWIDFRR